MRGRVKGRGVALISGLIFLAITVIFVSTALLVSTSNRRLSGDNVRTISAQLAADAGLERAIYEVWFKPNLEDGQLPNHFQLGLEAFRKGLDDAGIAAGNTSSATSFAFGPAVTFSDSFETTAYSTTLRRLDVGDAYTVLRLDSVGTVGTAGNVNNLATRRITEDLLIGVPQAEASQFALLSNRANCVFCHTQITSLEVAYDAQGNLVNLDTLATEQARAKVFKNKQRIRVGVLEHLLTDRANEIKSLMTGTLYSRGETNLFSAQSTLYSLAFSEMDGHKTSRLSSDEPKVLHSATNCASGCSERLEQAYLNYPSQGYPDGELPNVFPSAIQDANNNQKIEHSEWQTTISQDDALGSLKGGVKKRVDTSASGTVTLSADRSTGLHTASATLSSTESANGIEGNLILEGSASSPLILEDTVYVNGDVVIRGKISGDGKIVARGNIYVVGNTTYACDNDSRDFNWASSSQVPCNYALPDTLPRVGLVAGKNLMLGNYMMPNLSGGTRPEDQLTRLGFSETSAEDLALWFVDAGQPITENAALSYSMIQAALFNQEEYAKAHSDASYIPHFYRMREDSPVWLCAGGFSTQKNDYCKSYTGLVNLSLSTSSSDAAILNRASVLSLTPSDSWLSPAAAVLSAQTSELAVRGYWVNAVESNSAQEALRIDGVLFSDNAVFGMLPSSSATKGKMLLNGSLIAADTALLPTAGFRIHYDERLSDLIDPSKIKTVVQTRSNYRLLKTGELVDYGSVGY
jgi:hypothetical protein